MSEPGIVQEAEQLLAYWDGDGEARGHAFYCRADLFRNLVAEVRRLEAERDRHEGRAMSEQTEALKARLADLIARHDMGYSERFDADAERFYRETGFMAPGKSVPMAMAGSFSEDEREQAWEVWTAAQSEGYKQLLRDLLANVTALEAEQIAARGQLDTERVMSASLRIVRNIDVSVIASLSFECQQTKSRLSALVAGVQQVEQEMRADNLTLSSGTISRWAGYLTALRIAATGGEK